MKGGHPNERSRRNWGSLDLDRRHLGSLYFTCHRFSRLYLLIACYMAISSERAYGYLFILALLIQQGYSA